MTTLQREVNGGAGVSGAATKIQTLISGLSESQNFESFCPVFYKFISVEARQAEAIQRKKRISWDQPRKKTKKRKRKRRKKQNMPILVMRAPTMMMRVERRKRRRSKLGLPRKKRRRRKKRKQKRRKLKVKSRKN